MFFARIYTKQCTTWKANVEAWQSTIVLHQEGIARYKYNNTAKKCKVYLIIHDIRTRLSSNLSVHISTPPPYGIRLKQRYILIDMISDYKSSI